VIIRTSKQTHEQRVEPVPLLIVENPLTF